MKRHLLTFVALVCSLMVSAYDFEKDLIYYNITSETDLTVEVTSSRSFSENQIYSWQGAAGGATEKGGVATGHGACEGRVNYANGDYYTLSVSGKKANIDTDYILITLDQPLEANDKLEITAYRNKDTDANGTLYILFENGQAIDEGGEVVWNNVALGQEPNTNSYNVGEGAGSKTIKLVRSATSTNVFITKFVITRSANTSNITFADSMVKAICVARWDTNGDGELSPSEAARVTTIGTFEGNGKITSFDEFQYFTSVETLSKSAFQGCSSLTSITLPASVTSIGDYVFFGCSSLTSITLPEGVTSIGEYAFRDCSSLTSVTLPAGLTSIGEWAFFGCSSLTSVTLPAGLTSIGEGAFYDCSSLTSVTLPAGLTSIGRSAFFGCSSLTSVTLPAGLTSIGNYAFSYCSSLTSVTLPAGVTSIEYGAFRGCNNLKTVINLSALDIVKGENTHGHVAYYADKVLTPGVYLDHTELTMLEDDKIVLEATVIPEGSVTWSSSNKSVSIVDQAGHVTAVGPGTATITARAGNYSATCMVTVEPRWSFDAATGHLYVDKDYDYGSSLSNYPWDSFRESIKSVELSSNVTSIGDWAFYGCSSLTSITISEGVTSIGDEVFHGCSSLTSITLPAGVTSIGNYAFCGCSSLTSITLPEGVTSIGESAFFGCSSLTSVTLPAGVTSIGRSVFYGCSSLTSITLPAGVTSIGERAFEYCSSLTSITLPVGVTSIGVEAFQGCSLLTSITLPAGVTSIETQTFAYCSSLTSITLPEGVTSIGVSAFCSCSSLTSLTLPASVTSIGTAAFWDCSSLTSITLPAGVTSIGGSVFWNCSSLTSITIPESVTSIGDYAFRGCSSLTSITIPESVMSIGDHAFDSCTSLTSITLPAGLTSIGDWAFWCCDNLKTVINLSALDIVKGSDTHGHVAYYADKVLTPGVYLDHTELTMQEDDKIVLEATVIPEGPVTWSSSDETVATVKDGVVTTLKPGEVTITAKAGEQTAICVITVKAKEVIVNPEEAFYSWQGAAGGATEKGGVATGHGACEGRVNYANGDYYTLSVSGKKANIDTDYILITLDQPLEANDKLEITAYRNKDTDANGTLYILFENGQAIDEGGEVVWNNVALGQEPNTNSYNVGGGAGSKTFKLSRSATSTNVFITKFVITRSANGIEEVEVVVPAENIIYNLQGQKLNTNSTQGLPRGLYIINGKKVLVK